MAGKIRPLGAGAGEGARTFYNRVEASCTSKGATHKVLVAMIKKASFKENTVTISRAALSVEARVGLWSVKKAQAHLKAAGIIHAVAYPKGGRGCFTTWAITPAAEDRPQVDRSLSWGNDHPYWIEIRGALREISVSRWDNHFALLKFHMIEGDTLFVLAKNAYHCEKLQKYSHHLVEAAKFAGYPITHVEISY